MLTDKDIAKLRQELVDLFDKFEKDLNNLLLTRSHEGNPFFYDLKDELEGRFNEKIQNDNKEIEPSNLA